MAFKQLNTNSNYINKNVWHGLCIRFLDIFTDNILACKDV